MKRYKIALVCDWFLPRIGGQELHMRDLAQQLNQRGHEAHIICTMPGPELQDGVRVHRLDVPTLPHFETIFHPSSLRPLEQVLLRERFDVVHGHAGYSPLAHAGSYLAHQHGIPSVFTEHSVLRGAGVMLFRAVHALCPILRWPTLLTAVSSFVAEDLRRVSGRDEVFVLHNGVNPSQWTPQDSQELRVTSVMRFTRRKRPTAIVRAIPQILQRLPRELWPRFTLIGGGPMMPRVEAEAHRLGVRQHLDLPGLLPRDQVRRALSRSTVFALPTLKESLSIATLEALSAGLPVVAMSHGGVGDIIRSGIDGFLADTPEQFVEHIVALLRDRTLREAVAQSGRRQVDRFSWEQVIPRHLELYRLATERCRALPISDTPAMVA